MGNWFIYMDAQDAQDFFRKRPASNAANPQIRIAAKDVHRYSCLFVFIRGSSLKEIGSFTLV